MDIAQWTLLPLILITSLTLTIILSNMIIQRKYLKFSRTSLEESRKLTHAHFMLCEIIRALMFQTRKQLLH